MTAYRVVFDRIGRNHNVPPLEGAAAVDGNELAELIYRYARPHLRSRDVEVWLNLHTMDGAIYCGVRLGGRFTISTAESRRSDVRRLLAEARGAGGQR